VTEENTLIRRQIFAAIPSITVMQPRPAPVVCPLSQMFAFHTRGNIFNSTEFQNKRKNDISVLVDVCLMADSRKPYSNATSSTFCLGGVPPADHEHCCLLELAAASLIVVYRSFGGICCFHPHSRRVRYIRENTSLHVNMSLIALVLSGVKTFLFCMFSFREPFPREFS
jgi:hypothetical protein